MIYSVAIMSIAFLWLLYETRLLTVRLLVGKPHNIEIKDVLPIIMAAAILVSIVKSMGGDEPPKFIHKLKHAFRKWLNYSIG